MAAELMDRLEAALERTDLDQGQAARVLGTSPRTVSRWLHKEAKPRAESRERLLEFLAVLERLSSILQPQAAHDWFFTPNPLLSHQKPADLLAERRYRDLLGAIDQLGEGVFV
jgi:putative toxin-antitoxin system antitoxin component (TIGR02293 family)